LTDPRSAPIPPPAGLPDFATKSDLAVLEQRLDGRIGSGEEGGGSSLLAPVIVIVVAALVAGVVLVAVTRRGRVRY
jgi:hypothetical protein